MFRYRQGMWTGWVDFVLPRAAFPDSDHRRRIGASFCLALAAMQLAASTLFAIAETIAGHFVTAAVMAVGALLPIWSGLRLRRDGNVARWSQVLIANMFSVLGLVLLGSGGHSLGVLMALPALLLIGSLVSNVRQVLFLGVLVITLLLVGNHLRALPGPWPINIDTQRAQDSLSRVPVILTVCLLGMALLLQLLLSRIFSDLTQMRQREQAALERARFDQQRFADFADIAADWFWETDANLRLSYVSPGITEQTGLRADQVLGQHPVAILRARRADSAELREVDGKMARGEPFLDEKMAWRDAAGKLAVFRNIGRPMHTAEGRFLGYRGAATNITEAWRLTRELEILANTDPLTGLLNRRALAQALGVALAGVRDRGAAFWLFQLDLDHFKEVNDRAGHAVGDQILLQVAQLLRDAGLSSDSLARVGGDEFCALLREPDRDAVIDHAELVQAGLARFEAQFGHAVGASIGIVPLLASFDETQAMQAVDAACYRAKREGRGRIVAE